MGFIKRLGILLLLCLCCFVGFAQKVKKETGIYTYVVPDNVTKEQGKRIALERAKEDAINKAFGQIISRENLTRTDTSNGEATIDFTSLGQSLVKGEWVETIGEPEFVEDYDRTSGSFVILVQLKDVLESISPLK